MKRIIFFIIIIFPLLTNGQNFSLNRGIPFIKNYSQNEYNAHEQNFDIVQDSMGIMYFANFEAVLIYEGSEWVKIPTNSGMRVLSLDVCCSGTVYAGGLYDFGFLKRDNFGRFSYQTLVDSTFEASFVGEIFSVIAIKDKVYFVSKNRMFIYQNEEIEVVEFPKEALSAYKSNDQLFVFFKLDITNQQDLYNGLTVFQNNAFAKINDKTSEKLTGAVTAFYLSDGSYIIGTENQGFFIQKNQQITEFDVQVNDFVKKNTLTCGVKISDDLYAIGTLTQGVLIVSASGQILQIVNKHSSLKDEAINSIYKDNSGNLWVATNNGISVIEINNALSSIYNENSGIEGKINKILEYNSSIYLATDYGLYKYSNNNFDKIPGLDIACRDAKSVGNKMIIATPQGVYFYENQKIFSTEIKDFSFCIEEKNGKVFVGQNSKVIVAEIKNNKIIVNDTITGIMGNVTELKATNNYIYAEIPAGKIYKANINSLVISEIKTGSEFISLHLNEIDNKVFFSSEKGLFIEKDGVDTIIPFQIVQTKPESSSIWLYELFKIKSDLYVFTDGGRKNPSFLNISANDYNISQNYLLPISDFAVRTWYLDEQNENLLLGGNEGVIVYGYGKNYLQNNNYKVFFTEISTVKNDSLLELNNSTDELRKFKYSDNSLLFKYSAAYYPAKGDIFYRYFLQGFDEDTSDWSMVNYKEYTNLPSGYYNFFVEAKDQFGNVVQASSYEFKILVPLGRRWWMIVIYIVLAIVLVKVFVDWRMKISEQEKIKLEEIIKERTEEIEKSKAEIEAQRDVEYAQRKEIMASIHYAKRIQQAVLPSQNILTNAFKENYFIFFRPYEVVSGDFFWMKELKNFVAIVAADCTGHGVPGAFMSMLGTSFLNEIVTRRSLDSAAEVLERLRQKVKTSLHQEGKMNEQKDGMDLAMYFIDKETLSLQYSGAYNPLYIVRKKQDITDDFRKYAEENTKKFRIFEDEQANSNYSLIELKANRQPIGIHVRELPFENISFQLIKGDSLYTFSDGYQDQFGGDTGEKFNAKRFKRLFLSIQEKDMKEQHRILDQNFIKWKGDLNQVDDVLVIGVKIDF